MRIKMVGQCIDPGRPIKEAYMAILEQKSRRVISHCSVFLNKYYAGKAEKI